VKPTPEVKIRKIRLEDAEAFLRFSQKADEESDYMAMYPGERNWTVEKQRALLEEFLSHPRNTHLVAEVNGELVGSIKGVGGTVRKNEHSATILGMAVLTKYRGLRIGTQLMMALEAWARSLGMTRIDLTTMVPNELGQRLYRSCGYEEEGIKRWSQKLNGKYVDEIYFAKLLK
jgi:ribosomal protein S18 acetylase RimI-like enzyme